MLERVTPLIITHDEAPNIGRTLERLAWARRIVVVDSGSTDGTLELLARHRSVDVHHRPFDGFAAQCNFGLSHVDTPWVLSLDADYVLSDELVRELATLRERDDVGGFRARFVYKVHGHALRGTLYPPRVILHRVAGSTYEDVGHGHRVRANGRVEDLRGVVYHDDRKPFARWLASQARYADRESEYLLEGDPASFGIADRIRRLNWVAPLGILPYTLLVKRCVLDGWPGWYYALQREYAECLIALALLERRFGGRGGGTADRGEA